MTTKKSTLGARKAMAKALKKARATINPKSWPKNNLLNKRKIRVLLGRTGEVIFDKVKRAKYGLVTTGAVGVKGINDASTPRVGISKMLVTAVEGITNATSSLPRGEALL